MAHLPDGIDRSRRHYFSVGNVLTLLMMFGALAGVWGTNAADNADTKRRVTTLEQGEQSTRKIIKDTGDEIKSDVKETKQVMNMILQELRAMQAVERERERARRGRDGQ